jgi:hypothetical protein
LLQFFYFKQERISEGHNEGVVARSRFVIPYDKTISFINASHSCASRASVMLTGVDSVIGWDERENAFALRTPKCRLFPPSRHCEKETPAKVDPFRKRYSNTIMESIHNLDKKKDPPTMRELAIGYSAKGP